MKNFITIILLILIYNIGFSQTGCIKGNIYSKHDSSKVVGVQILLNEKNNSTSTDYNGYFEICDLNPGKYSFGVIFIGYKDTSIYNIDVYANKTVDFKIYLSECEYHTLGNSNICPICNKNDLVIPILYGMKTKKMIRKSKKGIAYLGSARTGCDPHWFCKRDSIKF